MTGWIKTPLGTEEDLGPGDIVFDGDPALPSRERGTAAPRLFGQCLLRPRSSISNLGEFTPDYLTCKMYIAATV